MVEFALMFILLLTVFFGIIEFARLFQVWMTLQYSAQAGARYASTGLQSVEPSIDPWDQVRLDAIKAVVRNRCNNLVIDPSAGPTSPGYFNVAVYSSDPPVHGQEFPGGPNTQVDLDVVHNHKLITPFLNVIFPWIKLTAHAEKINERFRHPGYGTPAGVLPPTPVIPTPTETPTPLPTTTSTATPTETPTQTP